MRHSSIGKPRGVSSIRSAKVCNRRRWRRSREPFPTSVSAPRDTSTIQAHRRERIVHNRPGGTASRSPTIGPSSGPHRALTAPNRLLPGDPKLEAGTLNLTPPRIPAASQTPNTVFHRATPQDRAYPTNVSDRGSLRERDLPTFVTEWPRDTEDLHGIPIEAQLQTQPLPPAALLDRVPV